MEDKNRKLLNEAIEHEILELPKLTNGSKEKTEAVKGLSELYKLRIEEVKIEQAKAEKAEESAFKQKQFESQGFDRWLNFGLQIGLSLASLIAYDIWHRRGLKFQETGSITAPETRNLISRMLPNLRK